MKALPLFYYPTTILIIDDDKFLIAALEEIFINKNKTVSFLSSSDCLDFLNKYKPPINHKKLLQSVAENDNFVTPQHSPVDFDVTSLSSILNNSERHNEISTMLIDYKMPEINGFELAKKINNQLKKILLTGKALESEAIEGFNNNLINRFIQKGKEDTEKNILKYTDELMLNYFNELSLPLLSHLETDFLLPQSDAIFIEFFLELCSEKNIEEYYLIDKNGSYLCVDDKGQKFFLVIHTDRSIKNWLDLNQSENAFSDNQKSDIENRSIIPFFGIGKEAWQLDKDEWKKYLHIAFCLEGRENYYWAIVNTDDNLI